MTLRSLPLSPLLRAMFGLAAVVGPAALRAQAPTPPKVFYACYVPSTGTVYRIKETNVKQECVKATHVQFSWTDGAGHLSEVVTVRSASTLVSSHDYAAAEAICPSGTQATGGGYEIVYYPDNVVAPIIWQNRPLSTKSGWQVGFQNTSGSSAGFVAYVHCAR